MSIEGCIFRIFSIYIEEATATTHFQSQFQLRVFNRQKRNENTFCDLLDDDLLCALNI